MSLLRWYFKEPSCFGELELGNSINLPNPQELHYQMDRENILRWMEEQRKNEALRKERKEKLKNPKTIYKKRKPTKIEG